MKTFLALLFFLSLSCSAQDYVYRMDLRPPTEIFERGFAPAGDNPNLYQHVEGRTCWNGARTTGFVSTSSSERFAISWGSENLRPGTRFFVYSIRPTDRFYNTTRSLQHAFNQSANPLYDDIARTYTEQNEWASHGAIPTQRIVEGVEYISRGRNSAPERVTQRLNPHYVHVEASTNSAPYVWNYGEDSSRPPLAACTEMCKSVTRHERDLDHDNKTRENIVNCRREVRRRIDAILDVLPYGFDANEEDEH